MGDPRGGGLGVPKLCPQRRDRLSHFPVKLFRSSAALSACGGQE